MSHRYCCFFVIVLESANKCCVGELPTMFKMTSLNELRYTLPRVKAEHLVSDIW